MGKFGRQDFEKFWNAKGEYFQVGKAEVLKQYNASAPFRANLIRSYTKWNEAVVEKNYERIAYGTTIFMLIVAYKMNEYAGLDVNAIEKSQFLVRRDALLALSAVLVSAAIFWRIKGFGKNNESNKIIEEELNTELSLFNDDD